MTAGWGYGPPPYPWPPPYPPVPYAEWTQRASAYLIDLACSLGILLLVAIPSVIGMITVSVELGVAGLVLGYLAMLAFSIWQLIEQGRTGQTIGKRQLRIRLIAEATGRPIGAWMSVARQFVHVLDSYSYVGYLWPLWDAKKQTFADKILQTIVVRAPAA